MLVSSMADYFIQAAFMLLCSIGLSHFSSHGPAGKESISTVIFCFSDFYVTLEPDHAMRTSLIVL